MSKLTHKRRLAGLSQGELAALVGLSQTALSQIENGRSGGWPRTWRKLAAALECEVSDIMEVDRAESEV